MRHRTKSPTPGLRPAFATAPQLNRARGLGPKSAAQSTVSQSYEDLLLEVQDKLEFLIGYFQARIAARDARTRAPTPLPSLTSAFATRREIFGAFDGEDVDG